MSAIFSLIKNPIIVAVLLAIALGGTVLYYNLQVQKKNNTIVSLESDIKELTYIIAEKDSIIARLKDFVASVGQAENVTSQINNESEAINDKWENTTNTQDKLNSLGNFGVAKPRTPMTNPNGE